MLTDKHRSEITQGSAVASAICGANFWTVTDPSEVDELLNRNADRRWKHSDHLVPAWAVAGIDPQTEERWLKGVQIKPDTPVINADGKTQKYLSSSGYDTAPLFLDNGTPGYWPNILQDRSLPILITEGAKKAACLLSLNYAAVSLPGIWNGQIKGRLVPSIQQISGLGRKTYLVFDSDQITKPQVQQALDRLGRLLVAEGCVVYVVTWDAQYKGIDDLVANLGSDAAHHAIQQAQTFEEWRSQVKIPTDIFKNRENSGFVDPVVDPLLPRKNSQSQDCRLVDLVDPNDVRHLRIRSFETLDLSEFLPPYLADPLTRVAGCLPTAPEALLTSSLAVFASLIGAKALVQVKGGTGAWREPCVLWTQNVARTGSMKTATQDVLIKPLRRLQAQADKDHGLRLKDWKANKALFDRDKTGEVEDPGEEPKPREFYVSDATLEAIADSHKNNPDGFLMFLDELDGWYRSFNKYRNGTGDDEQTWLSFNSGGGIKKNRMNYRISIPKTAISITGSTQPETIAKHIGTDRDTTGMNARWLYCVPRMPLPYLKDSNEVSDIGERLFFIYKTLSSLPSSGVDNDGEAQPSVFSFHTEAFQVFMPWANSITDRWDKEPNQGFASSLIKFKGYAARIALVLHVLDAVCASAWPALVIPADTVRRAIKLAEYYIGQSEIVFKGMPLETDAQDLTPVMLRLIEISAKRGWITARVASQQSKLIKSTDMAYECFDQLANMGIGDIRLDGKKKEWKVKDEWLEKNGSQDGSTGSTSLQPKQVNEFSGNNESTTGSTTGSTNERDPIERDLINKEEINNISFSNTPASKYTPTPPGVDSSPPRKEDWRVWTRIGTAVNVLEFKWDKAHIRVPGESKTKWIPVSELKEG